MLMRLAREDLNTMSSVSVRRGVEGGRNVWLSAAKYYPLGCSY